ncbi:TetR family transcriptional regulator [Reticulibacter mediterranei]|uniref:TetR family transcriptional regulator n=1 Tax=Reticulibacter mediterranei TaxID=2778369 RepID=A0A8J3IFM7_9CHLR|nr:TetR/AcrR family transcriptional regulator [Reticulibacter mediterranei]GHO90319.1 TetR family transcriptional regulator [Reticulibacter mediterranei]
MFEEDPRHSGEKREAILEAALELIAEHGLQHTPMSLISKRAKASAGGIYHHFESKEDLLQTLYWRIKEEMTHAIVAADDLSQPLAKRFQTLWLSIFRYGLAHRQEMAFLEQYESVPRVKSQDARLPEEGTPLDDLIERFCTQNDLPGEVQILYRLIVDLRVQGLIKDLPLIIISELTYGAALRLAKHVHAGQVHLSDATLTETAKACWDAIAR